MFKRPNLNWLKLGAATVAMIAAPAIALAAPADKAPSSVGTWKLNLAESIAPQGSPFHPYTVVVKRADEVLDFTYSEERATGEPFEFAYSGKADGVVRDLGGGLKGAMVPLPSGNYEARLWSPNGTYVNKFCQLDAGGNKDICLATVTAPNGDVTFFKQVLDRQ